MLPVAWPSTISGTDDVKSRIRPSGDSTGKLSSLGSLGTRDSATAEPVSDSCTTGGGAAGGAVVVVVVVAPGVAAGGVEGPNSAPQPVDTADAVASETSTRRSRVELGRMEPPS